MLSATVLSAEGRVERPSSPLTDMNAETFDAKPLGDGFVVAWHWSSGVQLKVYNGEGALVLQDESSIDRGQHWAWEGTMNLLVNEANKQILMLYGLRDHPYEPEKGSAWIARFDCQ